MKKTCKVLVAILALCLAALVFVACDGAKANCEKDGHTWDEGVVTKEATCTEKGSKTVTCSVCNETSTVEIPLKPHTGVVDEAIPETCTTDGKTEGEHCSVCNAVIVEQIVVPKKGHVEMIDPAVPATCSTKGKTEGSHCPVCGLVVVAQNEIPTIQHTFVSSGEEVAPTCTENGSMPSSRCTACGLVEGGEVIPATGHNFIKIPAVEATCTSNGRKEGRYCSTCAYKEVGKQTIMLRHVGVEVKEKAATCTEDGNTAGKKCKYCGEWLEGKVIKATGHNIVESDSVPATCSAVGYVGGSKCSICNMVIVAAAEVPMDPGAHVVVTDAAVPATCSATGLTEGSHCSACKAVIVAQTETPIDPANHVGGGTATTTELAKCEGCGNEYGLYRTYSNIGFGEGTMFDDEGKVTFTNHNGVVKTTTVSHKGKTAEVDALVLSKSGDYVDCKFANITTVDEMRAFVKKGFTVETFYVLKDKSSTQGVVCAAATVSNVNGGWGIAEKNSGKPYFITGKGGKNGWASADSTTATSTAELVHVVGVFDGASNKVKIYVNGVLSAEAATGGAFEPLAGANNFNMFCLGAGKGSTSFASKGMVMVSTKIYEAALNAEQAKLTYDTAVAALNLQ